MCECCGENPTVTSVSAMLMSGASPHSIRIAVCQKCRDSAQRRDFDTWQRIKALLIASQDLGPSQHSVYGRQLRN
jgi:hypothetical protein